MDPAWVYVCSLGGLLLGAAGGCALTCWRRSRPAALPTPVEAAAPSPDVELREFGELLTQIESTLETQRQRLTELQGDAAHPAGGDWDRFLRDNAALLERLENASGTVRSQAERVEQLVREARTDALTGVWNRRAFEEHLALQLAIARRYHTPFSLVLFDLDWFKRVNDRHGHLAGDALLKQVALLIAKSVRNCDLVARYGGEEFAVLLPQTGVEGAAVVADRIRQTAAECAFEITGGTLRQTLSGGVASVEEDDSFLALVARADRALYRAKQTGRDRICVHSGAGLFEAGPRSATA